VHTWVLVLVPNGYPEAVEGDACRYAQGAIPRGARQPAPLSGPWAFTIIAVFIAVLIIIVAVTVAVVTMLPLLFLLNLLLLLLLLLLLRIPLIVTG
jgi:apolipoprotein N-acyltransferase